MHHDLEGEVTLRFYLDRLPYRGKLSNFRGFITNLADSHFTDKGLIIKKENITEIDSTNHILLQALDIILGSIQFKLNRKDLFRIRPRAIPNKTRAKISLYRTIYRKICEIKPRFNIGVSTGSYGRIECRWTDCYRHWLLKPYDSTTDIE